MNKNIGLRNGTITRQLDNVIVDSSGKGSLCPVGTIMAVLDNASITSELSTTKGSYWKLCDGSAVTVTLEDGTISGVSTLPDLTSDIFLMGGTGTSGGATDDGGDNDGHNHTTVAGQLTGDLNSGSITGGLTGHTHNWTGNTNDQNGGDNQVSPSNNPRGNSYDSTFGENTDASPDAMNHTHNVSFSGTVGPNSGPDGDDTGTNRPQYIKALFYMRVL